MMFFPQDPASREAAEKGFEKLVAEEEQVFPRMANCSHQ
jgi:hypothetical protein